MGKSYGTCGHEVEPGALTVAVKGYDIDHMASKYVRCVSYLVYCPKCVQASKEVGVLLENEDAEQHWLDTGY